MEKRIAELERSLQRVRLLAGVAALLALGLIVQAFTPPPEADVVRARGFVVVDGEGRERILIGAPIPSAVSRIRTDAARVRETWAGRFPDPDKYMEWYAGYQHSMNGILILDENGFDRLALGNPTPDPNIGRRIGPSTGLQINDAQGFERSGYSLLTVNGTDRVVLGLDSNRGTEALTLSVHDTGSVGMHINGGGETVFLGQEPEGLGSKAGEPFTGLAVYRGEDILYSAGPEAGGD